MKKLTMMLIVTFVGIAAVPSFLLPTPVYADNNCVETSIIGNGEVCDDGEGSSIYDILKKVVDIMSIFVGIVGVIGITVVGIQYLTAGGNEEKVRKSKRRMLEIVIGIVAYIVLYAALTWLLPTFNGVNQPGKGASVESQIDSNGYTNKTCAESGMTWVWADRNNGTGYCKVY